MKNFYDSNTIPGTAWTEETALTRSFQTHLEERNLTNSKSDKSRNPNWESKPVVGPTPTPKLDRAEGALSRLLSMDIPYALMVSKSTIPPELVIIRVKRGSEWKRTLKGNDSGKCSAKCRRLTKGRGLHAAVKKNLRNVIDLELLDTQEPKGTSAYTHHGFGISHGPSAGTSAGCLQPHDTQTPDLELGNQTPSLSLFNKSVRAGQPQGVFGNAFNQANASGNAEDKLNLNKNSIETYTKGATNE